MCICLFSGGAVCERAGGGRERETQEVKRSKQTEHRERGGKEKGDFKLANGTTIAREKERERERERESREGDSEKQGKVRVEQATSERVAAFAQTARREKGDKRRLRAMAAEHAQKQARKEKAGRARKKKRERKEEPSENSGSGKGGAAKRRRGRYAHDAEHAREMVLAQMDPARLRLTSSPAK